MNNVTSQNQMSLYEKVNKYAGIGCFLGAKTGAVLVACPMGLFASYALYDSMGLVVPHSDRFVANCADDRYQNNSLCQMEVSPAHILACMTFTTTTVVGITVGAVYGIWNHVFGK